LNHREWPKGLSLSHIPSSPSWAFDDSVAEVFDDMAVRSIPKYQEAISELVDVALVWSTPESDRPISSWVDLGSATGAVPFAAMKKGVPAESMTLVEPAKAMRAKLRERIGDGPRYVSEDAISFLSTLPNGSVDVVSSLWTAQFVPLEDRGILFDEVRRVLRPDGVFLIAEKVRGQTGRFEKMLRRRHEAWKEGNGYPREAIEIKRVSLRGVLVPVSAPELKNLLVSARFDVEEIVRFYNFGAWVAFPK